MTALKEDQLIDKTISFVRMRMEGLESGHDWSHVQRVWKMSLKIAGQEGGDRLVISMAALLHDIADHKFHHGDLKAGGDAARRWLNEINLDPGISERIADIVNKVSFKGSGMRDEMDSLEGKIVQDADRLDAMGAIGIARAFSYGGFKKRIMYDPTIPPLVHDTFEAYAGNSNPTINHFYEKLLLLKDRMHTATARRIAEERHAFMEVYLEQFFREWEM